MSVGGGSSWAAESAAEGRWGVAPHNRRLLGGDFDLSAEENQVYLFMVLFGIILFGTPPFLKLLQIVKKMRSEVQAEDDEMWNFQEEYEDMRNIRDPLEGDDDRKKKKRHHGQR